MQCSIWLHDINAPSAAINNGKKLLSLGQMEVYLRSLLSMYHLLKVNKRWHGRKRWEKEPNTVKGAISLNLRHPSGCHKYYDLVPFPVLDTIFLYLESCDISIQWTHSSVFLNIYFQWWKHLYNIKGIRISKIKYNI